MYGRTHACFVLKEVAAKVSFVRAFTQRRKHAAKRGSCRECVALGPLAGLGPRAATPGSCRECVALGLLADLGSCAAPFPRLPRKKERPRNNLPCKEVVVQGGWAGNENVGLSPTGYGCITVVTLLHFVHPM